VRTLPQTFPPVWTGVGPGTAGGSGAIPNGGTYTWQLTRTTSQGSTVVGVSNTIDTWEVQYKTKYPDGSHGIGLIEWGSPSSDTEWSTLVTDAAGNTTFVDINRSSNGVRTVHTKFTIGGQTTDIYEVHDPNGTWTRDTTFTTPDGHTTTTHQEYNPDGTPKTSDNQDSPPDSDDVSADAMAAADDDAVSDDEADEDEATDSDGIAASSVLDSMEPPPDNDGMASSSASDMDEMTAAPDMEIVDPPSDTEPIEPAPNEFAGAAPDMSTMDPPPEIDMDTVEPPPDISMA
jgi:hypothetical protein